MEIIDRKSAIASGSARYFTGEPCKHGHLSERYTINTACIDCQRPAGLIGRPVKTIHPEQLELEKRKLALRERTAAIKEEEIRFREANRKLREERGSFEAKRVEDRLNQREITATRRQTKVEMQDIHLMMRDATRLLDLKMAVWGSAVVRVPSITLADVFVRSREGSIHTVRCFVEDAEGLVALAKELERDFLQRLNIEIQARREAIIAAPPEPDQEDFERKFPEGDPR